MNFNTQTLAFSLQFQADASIKAPTVIFASQDFWYTSGFDISVSPSATNQVTRTKRNFVEITSSASGPVTVSIVHKK